MKETNMETTIKTSIGTSRTRKMRLDTTETPHTNKIQAVGRVGSDTVVLFYTLYALVPVFFIALGILAYSLIK